MSVCLAIARLHSMATMLSPFHLSISKHPLYKLSHFVQVALISSSIVVKSRYSILLCQGLYFANLLFCIAQVLVRPLSVAPMTYSQCSCQCLPSADIISQTVRIECHSFLSHGRISVQLRDFLLTKSAQS